jgi:hypothetical protein
VDHDRSIARQTGLAVVAFVATLVLLAGVWLLVSRSSGGGVARATPSPPTSAPSTGAGQTPSPSRTAPRPPSFAPGSSGDIPTIVLTGAGDIADCSLAGAGQTADLLGRETGWFFTAGDNAYEDGSAVDFGSCYQPTWGEYKDRTILPVAGNHDWNTDGAAGYLGYFGSAAAPHGTTWYSMDVGNWHVVALDSDCAKVGGCGPGSQEYEWLAADLGASQARCTLALWHHPRFSSGEHGNDAAVAPFWDLLHAHGAELIVNGHDHDYERFAPQDPAGAEERPGGIREIVVGTGGAGLRSFKAVVPNSEFRLEGTYGVLRLTLHPFNYDWEFVPVSGDVADAGSTPCH